MKKNNLPQDNALRSVMKRRAEAAERVRLSEDFTDRLMASIEKQKTLSKQKKLWPYAASLLAIAASVLLILVFQYDKVEPEQQPVLAQQPEQHDAGKSIQLGKTEANRASIDGDFDIFGNLAHSDSFMVYLQGINLNLIVQARLIGDLFLTIMISAKL